MVKPLRSDIPNPPDVQFKDFGVLNDGSQSKGAFTFSIVTNVTIAALLIVIGSVVKDKIAPPPPKVITMVEPIKEPPPEPKPPPPPPPKLPPPPVIKVQPPKIKMPEPIEKPPDLKPVPVMKPEAVHLAPAPPKLVTPPPAPVKVNLAVAKAASVPNNDAHPSAISLGHPDNPIKANLAGPAVSKINLGNAGAPGMPPGNTGNGPHASKVDMGSGSKYSQNLAGGDNASRPVVGVKLGTPGGTGPLTSTNFANKPVQLQVQTQARPTNTPQVQQVAKGNPPKLTYKPEPVYTEEAKAIHLEGVVTVHITVTATGAVQVLGVTKGLGHGLDQQALRAAQGMKFIPATDANGHSVDWTGDVKVTFQMLS